MGDFFSDFINGVIVWVYDKIFKSVRVFDICFYCFVIDIRLGVNLGFRCYFNMYIYVMG